MRWSIIEAFTFNGLLFAHQYLLFRVNTPGFYGFIGSLFGIIYFLVKFLDLGLNKTLISFYLDYSKNSNALFFFIKYNLLPTIFLYIFCSVALLYIQSNWSSTIPFIASISTELLLILLGLVATESIKSLVKRLLQLSHHFRYVALMEIIFILLYQCAVWTYYYYGNQLTAIFVFQSFFIVSLLETIGLSLLVYKWYKNTPIESPTTIQINNWLVIKNRLFSYCYTMCKQILSANILVPLFAYTFGYEYAALLKLASYATHSIASTMERIIDPTSSVLFAHIKNDTIDSKQTSFSLATQGSYQLLACVLIFIIINGPIVLKISSVNAITVAVGLYFLIHYLENFFIVVERFYIAHGRTECILIAMAFSTTLGILALKNSYSLIYVLLLLFISRLVSFFILLFYLSYLWNINHRIIISPQYIFASLFISIIFSILF